MAIQKYKKRICLDEFISRLPSFVKSIDNEVNSSDVSWGKIPYDIVIMKDNVELQTIKYNTLLNLYYNLLYVVNTALYFELDKSGKKWIRKFYENNSVFEDFENITFATELPLIRNEKELETYTDKIVFGITSEAGMKVFYDDIKILTEPLNKIEEGKYQNGFQAINKINEILGKVEVPSKYDNIYVPKSLFLYEVPLLILTLNELKDKKNLYKSCCDKITYDDYGGDDFLEFLKGLKDDSISYNPENIQFKVPTLDLPILLTGKLLDLGQYKAYQVDFLNEDGTLNKGTVSTQGAELPETSYAVITSGLSKLQTLKKRKMSIDDYGNNLPGIYELNKTKLELPFQIDYIKNIQIYNNKYFGDTITSIKESCTPTEVDLDTYKRYLNYNYIEGQSTIDAKYYSPSNNIKLGGNIKQMKTVYFLMEDDLNYRLSLLRHELYKNLNITYPTAMCLKQEYKFTYELTYMTTDDEGRVGFVKEEVVTKEGTMYIIANDTKIEFTYVIGGELYMDNDKKILKSYKVNPFDIAKSRDDSNISFNGHGVWYRENFPIKKLQSKNFVINGSEQRLFYDEIVFNIDNVNENNIICNNVRYKGDTYKTTTTDDPVFRDGKMLGLCLPLKEDIDVVINRGTSAAFERHLQLSEIKTWDDLEKYRNGSFLNN